MRRHRNLAAALLLTIALAGCSTTKSQPAAEPVKPAAGTSGTIRPPDQQPIADSDNAVLNASDAVAANAAAARQRARGKTFEEFEASVYKDPGGKYIVNGDTPIANRKQLKEFYDRAVVAEPKRIELTVGTDNGVDTVWTTTAKKKITHCVSTTFGNRQQQVIDAMAGATSAWEGRADVKYIHVAAEDAHCDASNNNVVFDVRPVNVHGEYLARAFFPNEPRAARNVLIDETAFQLSPTGKLQLIGILRHELGHTLGLRHEQTRPEAGTCFEDSNWRPLTSYDKFSVMHYPQCNGGGDWSLQLTARDQSGIACLYGAAPGFQPNPAICTPITQPTAPLGSHPTILTFTNQKVAEGQQAPFAPFSVRSGTQLEVVMSGTGSDPGDPDLYVRFGAPPDLAKREWACRPYLEGAAETCTLDVPAGANEAFVTVVGFLQGSYNLTVKHTPAGH